MRCSECGATAAVMPTVYWPEDGDAAEEWPLCRSCYSDVAVEVLIVPGMSYAWGWCGSCQGWYSLNDMHKWSGGGPRGAPQGSCVACAEEPE